MTSDDSIVLGIIRTDGEYDTLSEGMTYHPDSVDEIVTPISLPWEDSVQLHAIPLADFGWSSHERNMGPEINYSFQHEGTNPSSNKPWSVEVALFEYPSGDLQITDVKTTGDASFAHFDPDDLVRYMYAVL